MTVAHARNTDIETSHEAARSVTRVTERQEAVMALLSFYGPLTQHAMEKLYGKAVVWRYPQQTPQSIRSRCSELVDRGLVRDSGKRIRLPSGRNAAVWELV